MPSHTLLPRVLGAYERIAENAQMVPVDRTIPWATSAGNGLHLSQYMTDPYPGAHGPPPPLKGVYGRVGTIEQPDELKALWDADPSSSVPLWEWDPEMRELQQWRHNDPNIQPFIACPSSRHEIRSG